MFAPPTDFFVERFRAAHVDGLDTAITGEFGEDERTGPYGNLKIQISYYSGSAVIWRGHATALFASANLLLLSFARFRFDDRYTGLANISGYLHHPVLPNLSATRLYMVFGTSLSY